MTEAEIYAIALSKYPIDEFWIGSGSSSRLYDQNSRDRMVFIKGFKEALTIPDVVGRSEQCVLHSTDWNGKCFKCGEQVFVREPK
jgi:hypothetical protein